ncbi:hypothetical protein LXL04_007743 [Taraxacum kok-saghyz]
MDFVWCSREETAVAGSKGRTKMVIVVDFFLSAEQQGSGFGFAHRRSRNGRWRMEVGGQIRHSKSEIDFQQEIHEKNAKNSISAKLCWRRQVTETLILAKPSDWAIRISIVRDVTVELLSKEGINNIVFPKHINNTSLKNANSTATEEEE